MMRTVCMIVQHPSVKGGIAAVVSGYRGSRLERDYRVIYVESYRDGSKIRKFLKALDGYRRFIGVLVKNTPDVVHLHSSFGASFYRSIPFILMAKYAGIRIINHIHGSAFDEFYESAAEWKKRLVRHIWGMCDGLIVLSGSWKDRFSVAVPKEKIHVVENYGITVPPFERPACRKQLLFLGAINRMKGCYDMIDIMARLREENDTVHLIMAGSGEEAAVRAEAEKRGVADNISFPGWVRNEEKDRLLRESDIFLLPSYTEAMPMAILDAMGYGLPVIASAVGGIPKLVEDGQNGFLCQPGDTDTFCRKILMLLTDDEKRVAYGRRSYQFVKTRYSLDRHIDGIEDVYRKILG